MAVGSTSIPPSRRPRPSIATEHENEPLVNHLGRLPLEMLAEMLSYTASPDILALARTSRYFCATLVTNPASQFIWRDARKRFRPHPIPDPTPNWTESAYIAFIFDPAQCEHCHQITQRTPFSYALRARLCASGRCQETWLNGLKTVSPQDTAEGAAHRAAVQSWLPSHDVTLSGQKYRPKEYDAAYQRHSDGIRDPAVYALVQQDFASKARFLEPIMIWAKELNIWGALLEIWRLEVNAENIQFLKAKAKQEGWDHADFVNTPLHTSIKKLMNKTFEKLRDRDYALLRPQFLEQVARCREVRVRRAMENTARINREEVRSYWNSLKTVATGPLPSYPEFRRLPMVRMLIMKNTTEALALDENKESVGEELRTNSATVKHIQQNIDIWLADAREKLAQKLGDPYSALAVPGGFIHPAERTTAWYRCTRCNRVGRRLEDHKALTFADVCAHQCLGLPKKDRLQGSWDVGWFEPDHKAIAATKELVRVCGLQEQRATMKELDAFGCRFLCKSCVNPIVFDASSVIGHCKRHETITLELLTQDQANSILKTPVERGLFSTLMGFNKSSARKRAQKAFACRHCKKQQPFTFDGLRSHVKAKHGIEHMRDEDFMRIIHDSKKD